MRDPGPELLKRRDTAAHTHVLVWALVSLGFTLASSTASGQGISRTTGGTASTASRSAGTAGQLANATDQPTTAAAAGQGITMSGTTLDLGFSTPGQANLFNYAVNLNVNAAMPYTIVATAPASLDSSAPANSIPIGRLAWRTHAFGGSFTPFIGGAQTIAGALPPTPPGGQTTTLDYTFTPSFVDRASKGDGSNPYHGIIVYTVTAGTVDSSFAAPNPFTPDGDGDNDRTSIHWWQADPTVIDATIYQANGTTLVRTITSFRSLGAGEQIVVWDGRDDNRDLVPEADYVYRITISPNQVVNPGLSIASGTIGVQRGIGSGTALIRGTVSSSQGSVIADATVVLFRDSGIKVATATTDTSGAYFFAGVGGGAYYLVTSAPSHYPDQSATFEVAAGSTVTLNIMLAHNHSLSIIKTASDTDAEPGDALGYVVTVSTKGSVETVTDVTVIDDLPPGLRFVRGSMRRNGLPVIPLSISDHHLIIPLGAMAPSEEVVITYNTAVVVGTKPGWLTNSARATGYVRGVLVRTEVSSASVYVHDGDMGDRSLVFGRVYIDRDGDGTFSPGDGRTPLAKVIFDDGTIATTDNLGRYSVRGVRGGPRALMAVLPNRKTVGAVVASGPSQTRLITLLDGVAALVDFAFTSDEAEREGEGSGRTFLGVFDASVGINFSGGGTAMLTLAGRGSFFVERDLGRGYSLTGSIDTRRDPRDEVGLFRDQVAFQPETGDTSRVARGPIDKVGLRLNAPWGKVFVGRSYAVFDSADIMNIYREMVGVDVTVGGSKWGWRGFLGMTKNQIRKDTFVNDGTTGPFVLSGAPIALGSERVRVETLDVDGHVTTSLGLATAVDYIIDYNTGQLFLTKPIPPLSTTGPTVLIIEYEQISNDEFPSSVLMGGRLAYAPIKPLRMGLSVFSEDSAPSRHTGAVLDAAYQARWVEVTAATAITNRGSREGPVNVDDDPTAHRVRATFRPHPSLDIFGYFSRIGGAYDQPVLSTSLAPSPTSYGYLPIPTPLFAPSLVENLFQGLEGFPFLLQSTRDSTELGVGTQIKDKNKEFSVASGATQFYSDGADKHTNYVTASWLSDKHKTLPMMFAGSSATTLSQGNEDRAWFLGLRQPRGFLHYDLELLHHSTNGDAPVTGNGVLLKTSYGRQPKLVPGLMAQFTKDERVGACGMTCEAVTLRRFAAGIESALVARVRLFAYASLASLDNAVASTRDATQTGGFGGFVLATKRVIGDLRIDGAEDSRIGLVVSVLSRMRVFLTSWLTASSYVQYRTGAGQDPRPSWFAVFGLAVRPSHNPKVFAFLKVKDKLVPSRYDTINNVRSQLITADLVLPSFKPFTLGSRFAAKRSSTYADSAVVVTLLAAEEVTWHFKDRYDLVGGLRAVRSSDGGTIAFGSTVGGGIWFDKTYRLMVGFNHSQRSWVFEADESIPGFFINITGIYGAAGAPSVMTW